MGKIDFTMSRLQEKYKKQVIPEMMKRFDYRNVMAVPKIEKVAINVGPGRIDAEAKVRDRDQTDLDVI